MRKNLIIAGLTLLAFATTSCQKDDAEFDATPFTATINETGEDTKTHLLDPYDSTTTLHVYPLKWDRTDEQNIKIYATTSSGQKNVEYAIDQVSAGGSKASFKPIDGASITKSSGNYEVFYPASYSTSKTEITLPLTQVYSRDANGCLSMKHSPMYAESSDRNLVFHNMCGGIYLHLQEPANNGQPIKVTQITITTDNQQISGKFTPTIVNGFKEIPTSNITGTVTTATQTNNKIVLDCSANGGVDISGANGADFHIILPTGTYRSLHIAILTSAKTQAIKHLTSSASFTIKRRYFLPIRFESATLDFQPPAGIVSGYYSINSARDQVFFANGNLMYADLGSSVNNYGRVWQFAPNQYYTLSSDHLSSYTNNNEADNDGRPIYRQKTGDNADWELFTWNGNSTSSNEGRNTITNANNVGSNFLDWGRLSIQNAGMMPNLWRTLTATEWNYVLRGRIRDYNTYGNDPDRKILSMVNGVAASYALVRVNGRMGLMIFPDNFEWPTQLANKYPETDLTNLYIYGGSGENTDLTQAVVNEWESRWENSQNYSVQEFAYLQAAGVTFMPCAGVRESGTKISETDINMRYWVAADVSSNSTTYYLGIIFSDVRSGTRLCEPGDLGSSRSPCTGRAVRLSQDAGNLLKRLAAIGQ